MNKCQESTNFLVLPGFDSVGGLAEDCDPAAQLWPECRVTRPAAAGSQDPAQPAKAGAMAKQGSNLPGFFFLDLILGYLFIGELYFAAKLQD